MQSPRSSVGPMQPAVPLPDRRRSSRAFVAVVAAGTAAAAWQAPRAAFAQVAATLNGAPIQVRPYVSEPGVPNITIPTGTLNPFPSSGTGTGTGTGTGAGTGTGTGTGGGSDPLNTMMGTSWGIAAVSAVESLGVNPTAIAATCVLESGCTNLSGSGAQGAFQMFPAAFSEGLSTALAANPALASQVVQGDAGRMDPLTSAIATAGYQMMAVQSLQNAGISDPTVLDGRGYFNFGPRYGPSLATAGPDELMSSVLSGTSAATLKSNGVTPGVTTVGQWRSSIASKIGNAANQSILNT